MSSLVNCRANSCVARNPKNCRVYLRNTIKFLTVGFCLSCVVSCSSSSTSTNSALVDSAPVKLVTTVPGSSATTLANANSTQLSFTLAVTGDILPHSRLWAGAQRNAAANSDANKDGHLYDFRPMFALVKPIISSVDLAICHLETPIAPDGEELSTFPYFGVPSEIADAIGDAGFDRCSTASNHAMDRGTRGIDATLNALDRARVAHTGMARTPSEINPYVFKVNGVQVAHMSYTFSYNGLPAANGETWRSALIDKDRILQDVRQARTLGAQVVLLSMHWGNERESAPSSFQQQIADEITKSGEVDLIIGSHAHVLQPIRKVNDTWVIYGLGNFLSDMPTTPKDPPWPASTQDGAIVTTTITVAEDGKVVVAQPVVTPTWVDRVSGWQIRSVIDELKNNDLNSATNNELKDSLRRTTKVVGEYISD